MYRVSQAIRSPHSLKCPKPGALCGVLALPLVVAPCVTCHGAWGVKKLLQGLIDVNWPVEGAMCVAVTIVMECHWGQPLRVVPLGLFALGP